MATLKVWNIEDELVINKEQDWHDAQGMLFDFLKEKGIWPSGAMGYQIKCNEFDEMVFIQDEIEDMNGAIVGRYEIKEG